MKKEIMQKWVKALRSGKYKKGKGKLRSEETNTYCCLGVLCEIAIKEGIIGRFTGGDPYPPSKVVLWAGATGGWEHSRNNTLPSLNDEGKKSFNYIANIIEKNYERL